MAAAKPKKSRPGGVALSLDKAIENLSTRLSSCRAVPKGGTLLIRATGDGGGEFHLEASEQAVRVTKAPASYRKLRHRSSRGNGAMLPKSICFVLAGLLVVIPLWILMSYGITVDGRPSSPKILIGMTFCFVVGVFWLYEDLKDLLRTR